MYPLAEAADAARAVQLNQHVGKVGVLTLAPGPDLGIEDAARRDRIGEDRLRLFRS